MAKDSEIENEIDKLCKEFGSEMTESNQKTKKSTKPAKYAVSKTPLSPEEKELRRLALIRLKERYSSNPSFANRDEAWWRAFQNSRAMAGG
jgi:hypothetical protein